MAFFDLLACQIPHNNLSASVPMNSKSCSTLMRQHWPVAIVLIFVLLIYAGIRYKAGVAVAPPYGDALQYYAKASFVWEDIRAGNPAKILASPPAMRPPGTALLLYPLGFKPSVRSYLVRSQFVPFLFWIASLLMLLWPVCRTARERLAASALVCCLGTLPMFFQFELNPASFDYYAVQAWGMVDTLLAAVGALSASLMIASVRSRSICLASAGWIASALCILIKPTGILIAASIGLIFVVEVIARTFAGAASGGIMNGRKIGTAVFVSVSLGIGAAILGATMWACVASPYLGSGTQQRFSEALVVSRQLYPILPLQQLLDFSKMVVGWPITAFFILAASLGSARLFFGPPQTHRRAFLLRLSGIVILLVASLCWWWFMSGPIYRYYFPFLAILILWILPDVFQQFRFVWPKWVTAPALVYLCFPPILLAALFFPPVVAQRLLGVNLSSGLWSDELKAGEAIIHEAETSGKQFKLYALDGVSTEFPHFQDYTKWVHSKQRGMLIWPVRPNEWSGDPGLRIERILECEYILFDGDVQPRTPATRKVVSNYYDELREFAVFANSLDENQGAARRRFGRLTAVHVTNRSLFEKAFWEWASELDWKTTFASRNPAKVGADAPTKQGTD